METITVYPVEELKTSFPDAYAKAFEQWRDRSQYREVPWSDEITESLKLLLRTCRITLRNWRIGPYDDRSCVFLDFPRHEIEAFRGKRAYAWLENNLFCKLREPYSINTIRRREYGYRGGAMPSCPLIGVCFDETYLEEIKKSIASGDTLKEAFDSLAIVASRLMEAEAEHMVSEDEFLVDCDHVGMRFSENGQRIII
jgi:hypothetical protein